MPFQLFSAYGMIFAFKYDVYYCFSGFIEFLLYKGLYEMVNFQNRTIVIVEDNLVLRDSLLDLLAIRGFNNVFAFRDAFKAVSYCKKSLPDLAVLDVEIAGLNGLDILVELKTLKPDLPVIMMSSCHSKNVILKACESGAESFFPKPLDADMFCRKVESLLQDIDFFH
jgi:DNA-binding response OmpR family regulator